LCGGTQRIDINYSMGLAATEEYITTDWGDAELRNCLGGYAEKRGGSGTEAGLPTIIIEHAFLSNENDYRNFLCTNDKLDALAKADAEGIIESIR